MKRISTVLLLPLMLFALERVNLIKDHSFEKDSEVWHTRVVCWTYPDCDAIVSRHDLENSYTGGFSGSGDTRIKPNIISTASNQQTLISQGFCEPKKVSDIDSLIVHYCVYPRRINFFEDFCLCQFTLLIDAHKPTEYWEVSYALKNNEFTLDSKNYEFRFITLEQMSFPSDTSWYVLAKDIGSSLVSDPDIQLNSSVDSLIFDVGGFMFNSWLGQKVFFDDVRLMGYADYDVGVKEIISPDGGSPYIPEAHIKNFGREPVDNFLVIATIAPVEGEVFYADTLIWSLPADTEDTISFSCFIPDDLGYYNLHIYTVMEPDECDEDDEMSKVLTFYSVTEPPPSHPNSLDLRINPICSSDIRVTYSLPQGHSGTLTLYDASGRHVDTNQVKGHGTTELDLDLAPGVYFVKLDASGVSLKRKVVVVR